MRAKSTGGPAPADGPPVRSGDTSGRPNGCAIAADGHDGGMHPHPPYQPSQPPVVYVQQKGGRATAVGVWLIVLAIFGPALLIVLCCAGLFLMGLI